MDEFAIILISLTKKKKDAQQVFVSITEILCFSCQRHTFIPTSYLSEVIFRTFSLPLMLPLGENYHQILLRSQIFSPTQRSATLPLGSVFLSRAQRAVTHSNNSLAEQQQQLTLLQWASWDPVKFAESSH